MLSTVRHNWRLTVLVSSGAQTQTQFDSTVAARYPLLQVVQLTTEYHTDSDCWPSIQTVIGQCAARDLSLEQTLDQSETVAY